MDQNWLSPRYKRQRAEEKCRILSVFYHCFIIFYPGQGQEGKEMISRSRTRGYKTDLKIQENSRDDKEKDIQVKDKRIKNDKKG